MVGRAAGLEMGMLAKRRKGPAAIRLAGQERSSGDRFAALTMLARNSSPETTVPTAARRSVM